MRDCYDCWQAAKVCAPCPTHGYGIVVRSVKVITLKPLVKNVCPCGETGCKRGCEE